MIDLNSLIGLTEDSAIEEIAAHDMKHRIRNKDGKAYICTRDYCSVRVNLSIKNNIVTSASIG